MFNIFGSTTQELTEDQQFMQQVKDCACGFPEHVENYEQEANAVCAHFLQDNNMLPTPYAIEVVREVFDKLVLH